MMRHILGKLLLATNAYYALPFEIYWNDKPQVKRIRLATSVVLHTKETYVYSNFELIQIFVIRSDIGIYCETYSTI